MSDLISRAAAIDALDEQIKFCDNALCDFNISLKDEYAVKVERASLCAYKEILEDLPSAQPELETVKCIIGGGYMDIGDADFSMKCAKCGAEYYHVECYDYDYNFCPNCGRRWR